MKAHVLTGSKQEIAERLTRLSGDVREVIVFVDEPAPATPAVGGVEDMFAEMEPYMVDVPEVDDSREAIYTRLGGE